MRKKDKLENKKIKAVDFFCGGGGMSFGMQQAGIKVLAGIDNEESCEKTYKANIKGAEFICEDVFKLKEEDLSKRLGLQKNDDELLLIGCSPCQFWSIINTNKDKTKQSANLLIEFERFIKYLHPGYVVVENVPGVLRKKEESGLNDLIKWLEENDYKVHFKVHNIDEYNVPQSRKRFTLIANRVTDVEIEPIKARGRKKTVRDTIGEHNGFPALKPGNKDPENKNTVAGLQEICLERMQHIKNDGGSRFDFAHIERLQLDCFIGKDNSFRDTFGRLWWDRPAPTITTKYYAVSSGRFTHPEENRALSIGEGAALQSFPKNYKLFGTNISSLARMVGNAVPPEYARRIGLSIKKNHLNAI